jgi:hypothetical protein
MIAKHHLGICLLAVALLRATAAPVPLAARERAALAARTENERFGRVRAGEEKPSILVPLIVVGFLSIIAWVVAGDDEKEPINFETLDP